MKVGEYENNKRRDQRLNATAVQMPDARGTRKSAFKRLLFLFVCGVVVHSTRCMYSNQLEAVLWNIREANGCQEGERRRWR